MKKAFFPVRSFMCGLPLSAAVQVPSFEYPSLLPEPPSLLPASPLPVRQNMNALVSPEKKLVKGTFHWGHTQWAKRNKQHKKGHSFNQTPITWDKSEESSHLFPVGEKKYWKMCTRVELMSSQMWLAKQMRAQLGYTSWNLYKHSLAGVMRSLNNTRHCDHVFSCLKRPKENIAEKVCSVVFRETDIIYPLNACTK